MEHEWNREGVMTEITVYIIFHGIMHLDVETMQK